MKANSLIVATLFVAFLLTVITLPPWLLSVRPEFTLIVLMYWALALPERCGLLAAILVGLFQDSFTASLLGKHILTYTIVIAIILFSYQRLRMFGVWQQAMFVFGLLVIERMIEYVIAVFTAQPAEAGWQFLLPALTGALIWPWLMVFLRGLRRNMGIMNKIL